MRLFFALLPNPDTCERLSGVAAHLQMPGSARILDRENYHVTLAFVGEVRDSHLAVYRNLGASLQVPQCVIDLNACEYWPSSQAVVLAARDNPQELVALTDQLKAAVVAHTPARSADKKWRAHATLARKVTQAPVLTVVASVPWISRAFALMRSATGRGHAVYTVVESWPLLDKS